MENTMKHFVICLCAVVLILSQTSGSHAQNRPPVIVTDPPTTGTVGLQYTYNPSAIDPDGDPLTFDLPISPGGMMIDPQTGRITWTPSAAGAFPVTLRVRDSAGAAALQDYTITVVAEPDNRPPVIITPPPGAGRR
jgi:Putative Ig domain